MLRNRYRNNVTLSPAPGDSASSVRRGRRELSGLDARGDGDVITCPLPQFFIFIFSHLRVRRCERDSPLTRARKCAMVIGVTDSTDPVGGEADVGRSEVANSAEADRVDGASPRPRQRTDLPSRLARMREIRKQRANLQREYALLKDTLDDPFPDWGPCTRCGHSWPGRSYDRPEYCPRCHCRGWWRDPLRKRSNARRPSDPPNERWYQPLAVLREQASHIETVPVMVPIVPIVPVPSNGTPAVLPPPPLLRSNLRFSAQASSSARPLPEPPQPEHLMRPALASVTEPPLNISVPAPFDGEPGTDFPEEALDGNDH